MYRVDRFRQRFEGAALIDDSKNIYYLTGYTGEGCLLVTGKSAVIITDFRYVEQCERQAPECRLEQTRAGVSREDVLKWLLKEENIGELSVVFRTQSDALISVMTEFFRLWKSIEDAHLAPLTGARHRYALYDGRFTRSIAAPDRDCTTEQLANALSEYIKLFDKLMKAYISGRLSAHEVEAAYYSQMLNSPVHI